MFTQKLDDGSRAQLTKSNRRKDRSNAHRYLIGIRLHDALTDIALGEMHTRNRPNYAVSVRERSHACRVHELLREDRWSLRRWPLHQSLY